MMRVLLSAVLSATLLGCASIGGFASTAPVQPRMSQPEYPVARLAAGIGGITVVGVTVNDRGSPVHVTVQESSGVMELDQAAVEAARRSSYSKAPRRKTRLVTITYDFDPRD